MGIEHAEGLVPGSPVDARIHACPKASHKTAQNDARSRPSAPVRRQPRRAVPAHAQVQEPPSSADVQRQARVSRTAFAAILVTPRKAARVNPRRTRTVSYLRCGPQHLTQRLPDCGSD